MSRMIRAVSAQTLVLHWLLSKHARSGLIEATQEIRLAVRTSTAILARVRVDRAGRTRQLAPVVGRIDPFQAR